MPNIASSIDLHRCSASVSAVLTHWITSVKVPVNCSLLKAFAVKQPPFLRFASDSWWAKGAGNCFQFWVFSLPKLSSRHNYRLFYLCQFLIQEVFSDDHSGISLQRICVSNLNLVSPRTLIVASKTGFPPFSNAVFAITIDSITSIMVQIDSFLLVKAISIEGWFLVLY